MHSKWKIWEYLNDKLDSIQLNPGINAFHCYHPIAFKMIKDRFDRKQLPEGKFKVVMGKECNFQWYEDTFRSLSLFGNNDSFLIHNAEEIPNDVKDTFINELDSLQDQLIVLNFNKEDELFKKLKKIKEEKIKTISIIAPAFWEEDNLLNFLCKYFNVYLDYESTEYFKSKVPFEFYSYYQYLEQTNLLYGNQKVSLENLSEMLDTVKFDTFKLAESFGSKKLKLFYELVIEAYQNGEDLIGPLYFLQSHIQKLFDQSYLEKKSRLTKYDKQIIHQSKLWKKTELLKAENYIGEVLIELKTNSSFFLDHLRLKKAKLINL